LLATFNSWRGGSQRAFFSKSLLKLVPMYFMRRT
jgi:hypothetical protein